MRDEGGGMKDERRRMKDEEGQGVSAEGGGRTTNKKPQSQVLLYQAPDGRTRLEVRLQDETVWLTQAQMAELFQRERSVITKHIRNIFEEGELVQSSVCADFAHTAADGKTYQTVCYNLDVIISVGYRVKSHRGTQFRI
jgi:hypothetical protein